MATSYGYQYASTGEHYTATTSDATWSTWVDGTTSTATTSSYVYTKWITGMERRRDECRMGDVYVRWVTNTTTSETLGSSITIDRAAYFDDENDAAGRVFGHWIQESDRQFEERGVPREVLQRERERIARNGFREPARPSTQELQRRAEMRRVAEEREKERKAAEKAKEDKALQLLNEVLTEEQNKELKEKGSFVLRAVGSGNQYRIKNGSSYNVEKLDKDGKVIEKLCFAPPDLHKYDVMALQKVMLEYDEEGARKAANISRF